MSAISSAMFESPQTLQDLEEFQPQAATTFQSAIKSNRLHHAYLLMCSQESVARQLAVAVAQTLMCQNVNKDSMSACLQCVGCRKLSG